MKAVRTLYFLLLSVGVVAPVAASPAVPAAAWPGVSDVLLTVAAPAPVAAWPGVLAVWPGLNHSHFVGMGTPSKAATWCSDQSIQRLVAEFAYFGAPDEVSTNDFTGIYQKRSFEVPDGCNTLYVTISAVGEVANDNDLLLRCLLDGLSCIGSSVPVDRGMGWMILTSDAQGYFDEETLTQDYKVPINYTWCIANVPAGFHNLEIQLGNEKLDEGEVSISTAHFYIDASHFDTGGCVEGDPGAGSQHGILPPLPRLP